MLFHLFGDLHRAQGNMDQKNGRTHGGHYSKHALFIYIPRPAVYAEMTKFVMPLLPDVLAATITNLFTAV